MPRENRKRGKKHKKNLVEEYKPCPPRAEIAQQPSWIISSSEAVDAEAPFGELESDVKAYFRTVDLQIRSWQGDQGETSEEDDFQLNESAYDLGSGTWLNVRMSCRKAYILYGCIGRDAREGKTTRH